MCGTPACLNFKYEWQLADSLEYPGVRKTSTGTINLCKCPFSVKVRINRRNTFLGFHPFRLLVVEVVYNHDVSPVDLNTLMLSKKFDEEAIELVIMHPAMKGLQSVMTMRLMIAAIPREISRLSDPQMFSKCSFAKRRFHGTIC